MRLRMTGVIPTLPHMLHGVNKKNKAFPEYNKALAQ
jgi:hypothetical protein